VREIEKKAKVYGEGRLTGLIEGVTCHSNSVLNKTTVEKDSAKGDRVRGSNEWPLYFSGQSEEYKVRGVRRSR